VLWAINTYSYTYTKNKIWHELNFIYRPYSAAFVSKLSTRNDQTDLYIPISAVSELAIYVFVA